jgi:hypothetical protein
MSKLECGNNNCRKYPLLGITTDYFRNCKLNDCDCCNYGSMYTHSSNRA